MTEPQSRSKIREALAWHALVLAVLLLLAAAG